MLNVEEHQSSWHGVLCRRNRQLVSEMWLEVHPDMTSVSFGPLVTANTTRTITGLQYIN